MKGRVEHRLEHRTTCRVDDVATAAPMKAQKEVVAFALVVDPRTAAVAPRSRRPASAGRRAQLRVYLRLPATRVRRMWLEIIGALEPVDAC